MDWRHRAICRDEDPELFFPVGTSGPALLQIAEAKAVCRRCPVMSDCLSWALHSGQDAGVWGGMSEDERRAVKRQHPAPARGPAPDAPAVCRNASRSTAHRGPAARPAASADSVSRGRPCSGMTSRARVPPSAAAAPG